jgi:glycine cleavage system H protein
MGAKQRTLQARSENASVKEERYGLQDPSPKLGTLPKVTSRLPFIWQRNKMSKTWYTKEHEYVIVENNVGVVGITDYAQGLLGDVVYVDLPQVGSDVTKESSVGAVESVKAASDIFTPLSGQVVEVNDSLTDNPQLVNSDPETIGWIYKLELADLSELDGLMSREEYNTYINKL